VFARLLWRWGGVTPAFGATSRPQRINPCPLTCRQYIKLLATRPAWAKETLSCARERVAGRDIGVGAGVGVDVDVVVGMLFPLLSLQLVRLSSASGVLVVAFELSHGHLASCPGKKCKSFVYIGHSRNLIPMPIPP